MMVCDGLPFIHRRLCHVHYALQAVRVCPQPLKSRGKEGSWALGAVQSDVAHPCSSWGLPHCTLRGPTPQLLHQASSRTLTLLPTLARSPPHHAGAQAPLCSTTLLPSPVPAPPHHAGTQ